MIPLTGTLSKGRLAKHLDIAFDHDYYFDPIKRHKIDAQCNAYAAQAFADLDIFYSESNLGQYEFFSKNQVLIGGIQPNMILGMLIGADFLPASDRDADISPTPLKGFALENLPKPESLLKHDLIQLFDSQIKDIQSKGERQAIPPFFWDASGRATFHGALTSAQKFLGESIFTDLIMQPEKIAAVTDLITECYIILAKHFSDIANLPITSVHVGECSGSLINAELFEKFVVPQAQRIANALGPLRFHTCGPSTHVLPAIKSVNGLAALDLGGDTSVASVRKIFGSNLHVDIAPLAADLSAPLPDRLLAWAQRAVEENRGGRMRIVYHLEPDYYIESVYALDNHLKSM